MPRRLAKNKTIEVILLQQDKHLGEKYEVVKVKPIFARNVLLPKKVAVLADKGNLNKYEQKMQAAEKDRVKKAADLNELFSKIENDGVMVITRKANKEDVLYAQITPEDVSTLIQEKYGTSVEPHYFKIKRKIKMLGEYTIPFIFKDLKKEIYLKVVGEKAEEEKKEKVKEEKTEEKPVEEVTKVKIVEKKTRKSE